MSELWVFNVHFSFLIAFGAGPGLHDPQLARPKTGEADLVQV